MPGKRARPMKAESVSTENAADHLLGRASGRNETRARDLTLPKTRSPRAC
jgi:hypothetical protein